MICIGAPHVRRSESCTTIGVSARMPTGGSRVRFAGIVPSGQIIWTNSCGTKSPACWKMERRYKRRLTDAKKPPEIQIREDNATKHCAKNKRDWETTWNGSSRHIKRECSAWEHYAKGSRK